MISTQRQSTRNPSSNKTKVNKTVKLPSNSSSLDKTSQKISHMYEYIRSTVQSQKLSVLQNK